jgi:hypothetical protein
MNAKSEIRAYLESRLEDEGPKGWLRRDPKTTHPAILALVRDFEESGGVFNEDAERYVEAAAGDLPKHYHHGHESRDPITYQLGHEVYLARGILKDEALRIEREAAYLAGYKPLEPATLQEGQRYLVRFGTQYVGQSETQYGKPKEMRVKVYDGRPMFLPKGARTNGYRAQTPALVRPA